jgi:hypothetical protein
MSIVENFKIFTCKSSVENIKVNTYSSNAYIALIKFLKEKDADFFTYQPKEDKPYRVLMKNVYPTTPVEYIKEELERNGFSARNIMNVLHKLSLCFFFLI